MDIQRGRFIKLNTSGLLHTSSKQVTEKSLQKSDKSNNNSKRYFKQRHWNLVPLKDRQGRDHQQAKQIEDEVINHIARSSATRWCDRDNCSAVPVKEQESRKVTQAKITFPPSTFPELTKRLFCILMLSKIKNKELISASSFNRDDKYGNCRWYLLFVFTFFPDTKISGRQSCFSHRKSRYPRWKARYFLTKLDNG